MIAEFLPQVVASLNKEKGDVRQVDGSNISMPTKQVKTSLHLPFRLFLLEEWNSI